jgi:hypothetical protein
MLKTKERKNSVFEDGLDTVYWNSAYEESSITRFFVVFGISYSSRPYLRLREKEFYIREGKKKMVAGGEMWVKSQCLRQRKKQGLFLLYCILYVKYTGCGF